MGCVERTGLSPSSFKPSIFPNAATALDPIVLSQVKDRLASTHAYSVP